MHGQSCRDLFERSVTVSLPEEVEAKRGDAAFHQHAGQGRIRCTVLAGKKPVAEDRDAVCTAAGDRQDCGDAMATRVVEDKPFFHGGDCSRVGRKAGTVRGKD